MQALIEALQAQAEKDAEALRECITHWENGTEHDEGAFDAECPDCIILSKARARLTSRIGNDYV